ncbi:MAG TPA: cation:proton antiporter [Roseiarcus sp.]|nr:cation:proton antiporter [Roseiarcus sp.]
MPDVILVLAVFAALLVLVALSQPVAERLRLAPVVLLAAIGAAIGAASTLLTHAQLSRETGEVVGLFANLPLGSDVFIYVFLPLLIFEAALTTDVRRVLDDAAPILLLAVIATLVAAAIVGLALWPVADQPLVVCLLLGAVVSTTDPAAVIAIFRDVGAPARLTRLVEGESLLNDASAILAYTVLLGIIATGREPHLGDGAIEFAVSFFGGAAFGVIAGRLMLALTGYTRDNPQAEATLTLALAYLSFIVADQVLHVSGVVATLAAGMTVSALGRTRIDPSNWSFLAGVWTQVAFWAHSLVFLLASILVPRLLIDLKPHDLVLMATLIVAAFVARLAVLFGLLPLLSLARLTKPISTAYKIAIAWGGLRGALTLVLALSVTENPAVPGSVQRFVAVLATGLVFFTLLVNGATLRVLIRALGLDRLSPADQVLRDRVLEVSYADACALIRKTADAHDLDPAASARALAPYEVWTKAAADQRAAHGVSLTEHERVAVSLAALGNQERALLLETLAARTASPAVVQTLMRNADAMVEGARADGRLGYKRAAEAGLAFPLSFRAAYFFYRRFGVNRFLAQRLGERFEWLLTMRLVIQELASEEAKRSRKIFGERVEAVVDRMLVERLNRIKTGLDALRRQYPDYSAALEARFLRQSALRREIARYRALFDEGLIASEVYRDLVSGVDNARHAEALPRFDIGLDARALMTRLDLFAGLEAKHLDSIATLLKPRFVFPRELIVRKGERGDAVYFVASGAAEVILPQGRVLLGSGDVFGEMALITGEPRQADVRSQTYSRLLVLRRADFQNLMRANSDLGAKFNAIAESRLAANRSAVA